MWQYLRLTGLVGSIESRASFYAGALERVEEQGERAPPGKSPGPSRSPRTPTTGTGALRVLLSGTADYALLALVARGLCKRGVVPAVTAIDLCGTPLALNRWYAERAAVRLETVHTDILHYRAAQPFDAVCTDNFLGRFPAAERDALTAKWRESLHPGGVVITASRLRPEATEERLGFSPRQVQAFRDTAYRVAAEMSGRLPVNATEFARRAEIYATRHYTYPVRSAQEVQSLFERAGFRVDHLAVVDSGGTATPAGISGPSVRGGLKKSLQIVATRLP